MNILRNKIIVESNDKLIWVLRRGWLEAKDQKKTIKIVFSKEKVLSIDKKDDFCDIWEKFESLFPATTPEEYLKTLLINS